MVDSIPFYPSTGSFENHTLADKVYRVIKSNVIRQEYQPGSRLADQDVADNLGISRTPVREAINRLVAEGLLLATPRRGVFVIDMSEKDIREIYEVRETLEVLAIQLAAKAASNDGIIPLKNLVIEQRNAYEKDDLVGCFDLDRKFHEALIAVSGNSILVDTYKTLSGKIQISRWRHCQNPGRAQKSICEHLAIIDALERKETEIAKRLLCEHIRTVKEDLTTVGQKEVKN